MSDQAPMASSNASPDQISVPLIEETARLGKREVTTGKVVVRTIVDVENHLLCEELSDELVDVERVPIDRRIDVAPAIRTEGAVTIIPVLEERLVVEKQLFLVEEVRITRRTAIETVEIPVQLRTQRVIVERT